jgi:two-component system cell cycle sensor histidine kinase/response regulator CckA
LIVRMTLTNCFWFIYCVKFSIQKMKKRESNMVISQDESQRRKLQEYIFNLEETRDRAEDLAIEHEKLKHSENLLLAILSGTIHGICLVRERKIVWCNKALSDIFGWEQDELVGKDTEILYPTTEDYMRGSDLLYRHLSEAGAIMIEHNFVHKGGHEVPCLLTGRPLNERRLELGVVLTITDITDRRRAEEALRKANDELETRVDERTAELMWSNKVLQQEMQERKRVAEALRRSESFLQNIFDGIQDGITILDRDLTVVRTNIWMERVFHEAMPLVGKKCYEVYHKRQSPCPRCPSMATLERGTMHREIVCFPDAERPTRWFEVSTFPLTNVTGSVDGVIAHGKDITDRKRADEERERLEVRFRQAQKMEAVGTLAGGIAHDFNNLLQAVHGYAELLLVGKYGKEPGYWELNEIVRAAQRGERLIRQLLTFSRRVESRICPTDLNREVRQVKDMLDRIIPRMVRIELDLAGDLRIINADPTQIEQVLMNLAINAKDAMPEGGRLVIRTQNTTLDEESCRALGVPEPGAYVLLTVSDTGQGMERETLGHIFEPFYTTKGVGKGTGLGLAVVYGVVKSHNGHISCFSEPGAGATFKVYFRAMEQHGNLAEPTETAPMIKGGTETIMLVDDEEFIRALGARMFEESGYTVLLAADGESALELYRREQERIDLVILDLIMPGMGGRKCLEELLRLDPDARVIISSGYSPDGRTQEILQAGAKGFVSKPFRVKEMLRVIREVLDKDGAGSLVATTPS